MSDKNKSSIGLQPKSSNLLRIFGSKKKDIDYDKIEGALTTENVKKQAKKVSLWKIIFFLIAIVISVLISLEDIVVTVVEAAADCATIPVTGGLAGLLTGGVNLANEVVTELVQDAIIAFTMILLSGGTRKSLIIRILIIGFCSIFDLIMSIITLLVPCIVDIAAAFTEIISEIIQNGVFIYSFFTMFGQ